MTKNDDGTANVSVVDSQGNAIASLDDGSGNPVNITFTSDDNYVPGDDEITQYLQLYLRYHIYYMNIINMVRFLF